MNIYMNGTVYSLTCLHADANIKIIISQGTRTNVQKSSIVASLCTCHYINMHFTAPATHQVCLLSVLFNDAVTVSGYIAPNRSVNGELERVWLEAIVA
jgi:hypothetical protein